VTSGELSASESAPSARGSSWVRTIVGKRADVPFVIAILVIAVAVACAVAPRVFAPYNPDGLGKELLTGPSSRHLLGTDEFGRDILSRIIAGARVELVISVLGVALALAIGLPIGLISGYQGGFVDSFLMRIQDALLAFPAVLFSILVVAAIGASKKSIILTIGVIYVPRFARLVRGSVMVLKQEDFVTASRASGATRRRLLVRHILPNCFASIMVQVTLAMAVAILIEAGLSYLGLGVQPPTATWGTMLKSAQSYPEQAPWYVLAPGICIFMLVLALNTVGDALRDRLDPRLRRL
jgi:peptide/nickel transport system permease protein